MSIKHQTENPQDPTQASGPQDQPPKLPGMRERLQQMASPEWRPTLWYVIVMLGILWFWQEAAHQLTTRTIPYSEFKQLVAQDRVADLTINETEITGQALPEPSVKAGSHPTAQTGAKPARPPSWQAADKGQPGGNAKSAPTSSTASAPSQHETNASQPDQSEAYPFRAVRVDDPELVRDLENAKVAFSGQRTGFMSRLIWAWVFPIAVMVLLWRLLARRMAGLGQGIMRIGSTNARLVAETGTHVTFDDVAGCEEAKLELQEVVSFLKDPGRYQALGATMPKGILLVGPPGSGKTLLARAVSGEARVPFFLLSGSDFVEMFVGVGAARVRDLFEKAKAQSPCIVFIDELDAVGRQRGIQMGPVNDEREQTLNQLLVGMDGFEANAGVIVLAATNRPEVLDRALLRPGRFDRQVLVDAPDLQGRLAVLKLHVRDKPLDKDVDLRRIAAQTPGFAGADLANIANEAALLAARHNSKTIGQKELEDAVDKVVAGPERRSRRLNEEDKCRVAYHEVGHALMAVHSQFGDPVHKITIIPHGRAALGYTLQLPEQDHYLMSRTALLDKLKGLLGGRAAEEIVFQEISTGAENDLEQATALARKMVGVYGMSSTIGLVHCAQKQSPFSIDPQGAVLQRDCSEETAREIDEEVRKMLDQAYADAKATLVAHRPQLDLVAEALLRQETLDGNALNRLLRQATVSSAQPEDRVLVHSGTES